MMNIAHRAAMLGLLGLTALTVSGQTKSEAKNRPWMNTKLSPERRADLVLNQLTLDEKISLLHGEGMARQQKDRTYRFNLGAKASEMKGKNASARIIARPRSDTKSKSLSVG